MDRLMSYRELEVIARGAEADIILAEWTGLEVIVKRRTPRGYMNPTLDSRIRYRRTIREAEALHAAKVAGVPTPLVYFVDPLAAEVFMQVIRGLRLKELLGMDPPSGVKLMEVVGEHLGRLHSNGIIHGDPTTSNFILADGVLVALDFGLSYRSQSPDDMAVDLHLLKEALGSYHSDVAEDGVAALLRGYSKQACNSQAVYRRLRRLESSGRYRGGWIVG